MIRAVKDWINRLSESPSALISALPRAAKSLKRRVRRERYRHRVRTGNVDFVAIDEMAVWTRDFVRYFPETYDAIVGIPRSGLLVAGIIATRMGRPLTTPDLLAEGRLWSSRILPSPDSSRIRSVLLVDDSIDRGTSMDAARAILEACPGPLQITTAALIAHRADARDRIDFHYRVLPHPTLFEWNLMHSKPSARVSASLEGVLDHRGRVPAYEIDLVLAQGNETLREQARSKLSGRGVRYGELVMIGGADKLDLLASTAPDLHLEGSLEEAQRVVEVTGIPTISFDVMELVGSLR